MDDLIQDRVFAFVLENTSVPRQRLTLNTTLSGDIGLGGDDAIAFFDAFREEFAVNLEVLHLFWDCYFAPEGLTLTSGLLYAIPGLVFGVLFTHFFPRLPDWFCFILAYALSFILLIFLSKLRNKQKTPQIAIQDLIDSAKSGRWTKEPPTRVTSQAVTGGRDARIN